MSEVARLHDQVSRVLKLQLDGMRMTIGGTRPIQGIVR